MSKMHYTELFYSVQGEGRYTGVPSVFLRMFGCNFRCKKFGRDKNEVIDGPNPEVKVIIQNIDQYKTFKDLPLVTTGCDTYSSIYPEFKRFVEKDETDTLADKIVNMLPYKEWVDEHLVITGGEPLLGWQSSYSDLLFHDKLLPLKELTFETNGTQKLQPKFRQVLLNWTLNDIFGKQAGLNGPRGWDRLTFSVSPKLSVSGEKWDDAIKPEIVKEYEEVGHTYLKFVVATPDDVNEAQQAVTAFRDAGFKGPVYLMPVGGVESLYYMNNRTVAEMALKWGWRYSDRLQVPLFRNAWGT
jgi:7-carboxy-7-deazaguanine synthase